jgi:RNA polymerase sigma factor (sigma-70 family)
MVRCAEMEDQTDEDLIVIMSFKDEDPAAARGAWEEFYTRHYAEVFRRIWLWICNRGPLDEDRAQYLVLEAFRALFESKAAKYEPVGGERTRQDRNAKAWFFRIVQNTINDEFRHTQPIYGKVVSLSDESGIEIADLENGSELFPYEEKVQRMGAILDSLSERDKKIAMTIASAINYDTGKQHRMSPREIHDLAEALETTPENVRQLRKRLKEKIRSVFESELPTTQIKSKMSGVTK